MKKEVPPNTYPINARDMSSALIIRKEKSLNQFKNLHYEKLV